MVVRSALPAKDDDGGEDWQVRDGSDAEDRANDEIKHELEKIGDKKSEESSAHTDDECFCVEKMRDIFLSSAKRTDDADLFDTLHDGDEGDDADHDG